MKFSLVVGTYGSRLKELRVLFESIERQTYKNLEVVVGTQQNYDEIKSLLEEFSFSSSIAKADGKGPSNSRNAALKNVTGDVLTLTDDDSWYKEDALEKVYEKISQDDPDIAIFQNHEPSTGRQLREYPREATTSMTRIELLKQMSLDIYINLNRVKMIEFDERFGINSLYNSGEDNIFLMDLYNMGYTKIHYYPIIITNHPYKKGNYMDEKSFIDKGPLFKRLFGPFKGILLLIPFGLKKKKEVSTNNDNKFWLLYFEMIKSFINFKV